MKGRKLGLAHDQRLHLAAESKHVGRSSLNAIANIVTSDTLMRWHEKLIAAK